MKKLLEVAARSADQAEVFSVRSDSGSLEMRNGTPTDISASIQSGFALRLIKDGRIGTAYTKNLLDREQLVRNAMAGLKGEVDAGCVIHGCNNCGLGRGAGPSGRTPRSP